MKVPRSISQFFPWLFGGPFRVAKRWRDKFSFFVHQMGECQWILNGNLKPGTEDAGYFDEYYCRPELPHVKEGIVMKFDGSRVHGGLTDRLRGILSTYEVAKKKGIKLYVSWDTPFELERYLEPAGADWRINPWEISYSDRQSMPVLIEDLSDFYSGLRLRAALKSGVPQLHIFSNSDEGRGDYRELYKEFFRPTPLLASAVEEHVRNLDGQYWAFSFRFLTLLGDFKDCTTKVLPEAEREELIRRNEEELLRMLAELPLGYRVLLASDSSTFLKRAAELDPRIYVVPGEIMHVDYADGTPHPDIWLKTFIDQQLLMNARRVVLMRTGEMYRSGFPRFAAEVGGAEFIEHQF